MPTYIIKLKNPKTGNDNYLLWSTVVDAPLTYGLPLESFKEFYQKEYGNKGMKELSDRLIRVEEKGTSEFNAKNVLDTIRVNRAGDGEKELNIDEIIEKYCIS